MAELVQLKGLKRGGSSTGDAYRDSIRKEHPAPSRQLPVLSPESSVLSPNSVLSPQSSVLPYWRSLEELADSNEFQELLHREFPENASEWTDDVGRRTFLKLMGASLALAGLTGCTRQPAEHIAPYVRQPEEIVPGRPLFYATSMPLAGFGTGVLVESHEGRPTKIEGNPDHPASLGGTDLSAQASILGLYDPDRSQTLTYLGEIVTWSAFLAAMKSAIEGQRSRSASGSPSGIRILTGTVTSPTLARQIKSLLAAVPGTKWHQYEPAGRNNALEGARLAFGQFANSIYKFDAADVILSLDADFLASGPGRLRYARDFAGKRRVGREKHEMNRLYVAESTFSITGSTADHRLPIRPSQIEGLARAIAARLGVQGAAPVAATGHEAWIEAVAKDLTKNRGRSLTLAGDSQPPIVHALAHAINDATGAAGSTVIYSDPVEANPVEETGSLRELVADIDAGNVGLLVILGGNPVYNAPADLDFGERLKRVPTRVHLSLYNDETSQICQWHIPEAHYLESWSDVRAFDGTVSIIQPLIAPLYSSCRTSHEVLAAFSAQPERKSHDIVREYWQLRLAAGGQEPPLEQAPANTAAPTPSGAKQTAPRATLASSAATPAFEKSWRKWLHDGVVENSALAPKALAMGSGWAGQPVSTRPAPDSQLEIVFRPDPTVHDGRFANNGWLQELPKPISKLTWDNAAIIGPALASALGVGTTNDGLVSNKIGGTGGEILADLVEISHEGRTLIAPAFIVPGVPENTVTLYLGYGRTGAGRVASDAGFNAYKLRTSSQGWFGTGARIARIAGEKVLAATQTHHAIDESVVGARDLIRSGTLEEYRNNPSLAPRRGPGDTGHGENGHGDTGHAEGSHNGEHPSLYPPFEYKDYAWGMAIDLNLCIGCNACVVACVAENNIAVVGKDQVLRRREMHWLRVDAYYKGNENNPETSFQPVPCQQCENAPCEVVCPVAATAHSAEGLNDMVYNRCVGTRYCSNNCPYKVRRFNFLLYQDFYTASLKMMRNPDVSVRSRGVMEKCTYCVQRIQQAKIKSELENRRVRDGEIVTACEGACPTQAIVFGDINDTASRVSKLKAEERNYSLLDELNTRPRTTYLAKVRNPNAEMA